MKYRMPLLAFLTLVFLCHISISIQATIRQSEIKVRLLEALVDYMMTNPENFQSVWFRYDEYGVARTALEFPRRVETEGKIVVLVYDTRDRFVGKGGSTLLKALRKQLEILYSYINLIATDLDYDIVAQFRNRDGDRIIGYFYGGHYWLGQT